MWGSEKGSPELARVGTEGTIHAAGSALEAAVGTEEGRGGCRTAKTHTSTASSRCEASVMLATHRRGALGAARLGGPGPLPSH